MKLVLRTLLFHFLCILLFAFIYRHLYIHFGKDKSKPNTGTGTGTGEMVDYLLLSVTIQAGIGISDLYPVSHLSKVVLMIHQFIVISTHVFTLYIFTI